jgi:hypothetical protein
VGLRLSPALLEPVRRACLLATLPCAANEILLRICLLGVEIRKLADALLWGAILWVHLLSVTRATMLAQELTIEHVQFIF